MSSLNTYTLLKNAVATGPGIGVNLDGKITEKHTVAVVYTSSTISALTVVIEGSLDGTNWFALATHPLSAAEITSKSAMFHIVDKPVSMLRANISVLTGLSSGDTVNVSYYGR